MLKSADRAGAASYPVTARQRAETSQFTDRELPPFWKRCLDRNHDFVTIDRKPVGETL